METKEKIIKKFEETSLTEKKAMAYDLLLQIETLQKQLQFINQIINTESIKTIPANPESDVEKI